MKSNEIRLISRDVLADLGLDQNEAETISHYSVAQLSEAEYVDVDPEKFKEGYRKGTRELILKYREFITH